MPAPRTARYNTKKSVLTYCEYHRSKRAEETSVPYGSKVPWTYTTDDGRQFRVSINAQLVSTANEQSPGVKWVGGSPAAATLPPKPAGLQMRRITVRDTTNKISKTVPVMTLTAPILSAIGQDLVLDHAGATSSFTFFGGLISEKDARRVQKS
jgi:hypothetical protein